MPTNDGDALRQAILAQPDDDIARLVYADWLDENGQASRAAFIRAQITAEQAEPHSPDARKHCATAQKLYDENWRGWTKYPGQCVLGWEFRRGFAEHAEVNVASFPREATALFAAEPIRSLKMTRFSPSIGEPVSLLPFFETPQLERINRLDLTGLGRNVAPVELEPLAESPYLSALTDLALCDTPVDPNWFEAVLIGPALRNLTGLNLADLAHLGPCLACALPQCPERRFLRLDLSRITFESAQLKAVLESRCLRGVEELRLGWMKWSGRLGALSHLDLSWGVIPWNRLRLLDLTGQGVGNEGAVQIMQALGRRKDQAPLRWLGLAHNYLSADSVRALVQSNPAKVQLYHLDVRGNDLTRTQVDALQARFPNAEIQSRDV
jgi:uncharacterized protein (TIGR02996 family)